MPGGPTRATLAGPTSGLCSLASAPFAVTLDAPAPAGGVRVAVSDTEGADAIATSPVVIAEGGTGGSFKVTPATCGHRSIGITTDPPLAVAGSPIDYDSQCACPDDAGANGQEQHWGRGPVACPPALGVTVGTTPASPAARDLYCTAGPLSMRMTE